MKHSLLSLQTLAVQAQQPVCAPMWHDATLSNSFTYGSYNAGTETIVTRGDNEITFRVREGSGYA
jgi:hypothetical protein